MTDLPPPDADGLSLEATVRGRGRPRSRAWARRGLGLAVVGLVVGAGALAVAGAGGTSSDRYRTSTAATRTVAEVLDAVATVEPVTQASVGFPVAGTVTSVTVQPGDAVATGQTLATLDTDDLQDAVDRARAELDQAELTLERALNGEDVSGPSGGGAGIIEVTPAAFSLADDTATASSQDDPLGGAQQAVLDAQSDVTAAMTSAQTALDSATAICAAVGEEDDPAACRDALQAALASQEDVTAAQTALVDAAAVLTDLLAQRAEAGAGAGDGDPASGAPADPGTGPEGSAPAGDLPSGTGGTGVTGATGAPETTTSSPTAEELIAYQKAVDAAAATLAAAEQAVGQATVVSPIPGTVVAVGPTEGDDVTAGSSTATIVVVGQGGYEVTTMVSVDDLPEVEVGQPARVTPDGGGAPIDGEVVGIGLAGTTSGSTTTYPVTIGLTDDASGLGNGATASVAVTTARATEAVAVPTSAVAAEGGRHTVQVVDGGADDEPRTVTVEVGAIGATWTEIRSGIAAGDAVVVADLDEPLPGSATDGSTSAGAAEGGFPGGGAGFPGRGGGSPPGGR